MDLPFTKSAQEVLDFYKVTEQEGLSKERIQQQRDIYGLNGTSCSLHRVWISFRNWAS